MADIKQIKVSNEIYDVNDSFARDSNYAKVVYEWDGNTEGLDKLSLIPDVLDYYRVGDAIEVADNEYLIGMATSFYRMFSGEDGIESMLIPVIFQSFGTINLFYDGISYKNGYAKLFEEIEQKATDAGLDFSVFSENGECFGFSYFGILGGMGMSVVPGLTPHYINTTNSITIPATLMSNLYGVENEVTFTPGLWLLKSDFGEFAGFKSLPVYTDLLYIPAKDATIIMEKNLEKFSYMMNNIHSVSTATIGTGISEYKVTNKSNFDDFPSNPGSKTDFSLDQKVYIWISLLSTAYEITNIEVEGQVTSTIYETSEILGIEGYDTKKYATFYMPDEGVSVTITVAAVETTTE